MSGYSHLQLLFNQLGDLRVRDKVLRLIQYGLLAAGPMLSPHNRLVSQRMSKDISLGLMVYRIVEDFPSLAHAVTYYQTGKSQLYLSWVLGMLNSVCDCLSGPVEQMAWLLQESNVEAAQRYKTLATKLWVMSLALSILRSLLMLRRYRRPSNQKGDGGEDQNARLYRHQVMSLISCAADICNGITMLKEKAPSKTRIGVLGTVSSVVGLYSVLAEKQQQLKEMQRAKLRSNAVVE